LRDPDPDTCLRAVEALAKVAEHDPDLTLRMALPPLRDALRRCPILQARTRRLLNETIRKIESATAAWKDLPLPGQGPGASGRNLPRPSSEQNSATSDRPLPSSPPPAE
jgi:hypothetical protein